MWAVMEDQKVLQFTFITGASVEQAKRLLEACNGDVNMAVSMHLDTHGASSSTGNNNARQDNDSMTYEERHGVRAPIPQTQGVLIEQDEPIRRSFHRPRALPTSVFDPFQDYSGGATAGPVDDKTNTLAKIFKPPLDLMFQGDFSEARLAGQSKGKWVLVNLQDSSEFNCQVLNRDLWSDMRVKRVIKDTFIFLQLQKITDEGIKFRQRYQVEDFPAINIIDPRTGEKMEHWNHVSVKEFLAKVAEFNSLNKLNEEHLPKEPTLYDKSEDAQLEAAIQASLTESQISHIIITNSDSDISAIELSDSDSDDGMEMDSIPLLNNTHVNNLLSSTDRRALRKRRLNVLGSTTDIGSEQYHPAVKTPRLDYTPPKSELSDGLENVQITDELTTKRGSKRKTRGGKGGTSKAATNREQELSSHVKRTSDCNNNDSVTLDCQILVRFPDGRRCVKSFHSQSPIKELFDCLMQEGYNPQEHEVTSTFPHCIISTLPSSTTFKDAGLYPRQTVYVQRAD